MPRQHSSPLMMSLLSSGNLTKPSDTHQSPRHSWLRQTSTRSSHFWSPHQAYGASLFAKTHSWLRLPSSTTRSPKVLVILRLQSALYKLFKHSSHPMLHYAVPCRALVLSRCPRARILEVAYTPFDDTIILPVSRLVSLHSAISVAY